MLFVCQASAKGENGFLTTHKWTAFLLVRRKPSKRLLEGNSSEARRAASSRGAQIFHAAVLSHLVGLPPYSGKLTFLSNCRGSPASQPGPSPPSVGGFPTIHSHKLSTAGRPSCTGREAAPTFHLSKWLRQQTLPCLHPYEFPICGSFKNAEPEFCEHTLTR